MSKFVTTVLGNKTEILKYPDHYVAIPVLVDDTGIVANADGKKIVAAGTIVGGGFLTTALTNQAKKAVMASLTTALTGTNNDVKFTSKVNTAVSITYTDPAGNDKALAVSVVGGDINVSLATGGAGAITSTAALIKAAIEANSAANALVGVTYPTGNDGSGVVTALTKTALADGVTAEGVLMDDVDVTYGDKAGAAVIHGFMALDKLPTAPTDAQKDALRGIIFVK